MLAQDATIGKSCPCVYNIEAKGRDIKIAVHGDDIVCAGEPDELDWLKTRFS